VSPVEKAVAYAAVYETASNMLQVEQLILASMDSLREFTVKSQQMTRIDHLQRAVDVLGRQMVGTPETAERTGK